MEQSNRTSLFGPMAEYHGFHIQPQVRKRKRFFSEYEISFLFLIFISAFGCHFNFQGFRDCV